MAIFRETVFKDEVVKTLLLLLLGGILVVIFLEGEGVDTDSIFPVDNILV